MYNSNILVILLLVGTFFTSTITMLPAAYSERGDDDGRSGDENKQKVVDHSVGNIADCDQYWIGKEFEDTEFQNEQIQECIASATREGVIRDRETPTPDGDGGTPQPPPPPIPFTISGTVFGTFTCGETTSSVTAFITDVEGEEDGTVSGSFDISIVRQGTFVLPVNSGTTDGNTFSLSGESGLCGGGTFTVSGNCGTGATVSYEETDATGTFTGNVDCTLLA